MLLHYFVGLGIGLFLAALFFINNKRIKPKL